MARVCHSLAACQRHTPSSLAAVIGQLPPEVCLSNNDVIALYVPYVSCVTCLTSLRSLRCVGWKRCLSQFRPAKLADSNLK